jgi:ribosomal protein L1
MAVVACHAADAMYGLGYADVGDPARVAPALQALAQAAGANLGAASADAPLQVPGMTPQPAAQALSLKGTLPDGRSVQGRVAVFAKGTRVYQATVFGPQLEADALDTFFGGLRLQS